MDTTKSEIINQMREVNMLLIQAKLHVGRAKLVRHLKREGQGGNDSSLHSQGRLLNILGLNSGSAETTPRDLGYIMGISSQAVSTLLDQLQAEGLIERSVSPQSEGTFTVALTEKGREALRQIKENRDETPDILDCLNDEELAQFGGYLRRIVDNAETKCADDEFSERRRAMREFLSLVHPDQAEAEAQEYGAPVQVERTASVTGGDAR